MPDQPSSQASAHAKDRGGYVPLIGFLRRYGRGDFQRDLVAGLIVAAISVPQAVAYAFLAGLPPQAGLYACLAPMVIYAVLGSSRHLVVGPVAVAALMVAAAIGLHAPNHQDNHLGVATVICLEAGLFLLLLRVTQMGGLVHLLSHPVVTGFVNAAAILIIISQLSALTGIPKDAGGIPVATVWSILTQASAANIATLVLGAASLALLWLARRHGDRLAGWLWPPLKNSQAVARAAPLVILLFASLVVALFGLDANFGIAVAGEVPGGLPELQAPPLEPLMWLELMPSSAMIAAVAFVESYTIGTSLAAREHSRLDNSQELLALGTANLAAGLTGATPVAGSFSRSSVNYQSGARTPVSSLICAAVILLVLLFLTPLFTALPQAVLAAVVILFVIGLIDLRSIARHWRFYREDGVTELVTLTTVLAFGVETGLIAGVLLSVAFFVRRSSRPHIALVGRIGESQSFRAVRRHDVETHDHIAALRIDENIYFANANNIETKLHRVIRRRPATDHVVLVCSAVNIIDVSGIEMLVRLNDNLNERGIKLHLSDVKARVMRQLRDSQLLKELTGHVYFTTDEAMNKLAEPEELAAAAAQHESQALRHGDESGGHQQPGTALGQDVRQI